MARRPARPVAMGAATVCLLVQMGTAVAQKEPSEDLQALDWDKPVWCLFDGKGSAIFAQCDTKTKVCLFHRGCFGDSQDEECRPLDRLKTCEEPEPNHRFEALVKHGMTFVPAIAETPPGWTRDASGRVFQTEFDMNRRVWLGGRWTPSYAPRGREQLGRAVIETGIRGEVLSYDTRSRYRFRALVGEVALNPLSVDATLFRFDTSHESETPFVRMTTFWPDPARHDLYLNVGWWTDVMGVEHRPRDSVDETHLRFVAAGTTLDLWHSADLASFFRLRLGGAFDDLYLRGGEVNHRLALTPLSALEADVIFDEGGMHRLTASTGYQAPLVWKTDANPPQLVHRFINSLAYEVIWLAINDQPVTFRLSADGGYRNDVLPEAAGWEIGGGAGLRINFWAPPPSQDDRERVQEER